MTSLSLLLWIGLAIALQLAVYLGFALRRRWNDYQALPGGREGPALGSSFLASHPRATCSNYPKSTAYP